jgi:hypothetical protein
MKRPSIVEGVLVESEVSVSSWTLRVDQGALKKNFFETVKLQC